MRFPDSALLRAHKRATLYIALLSATLGKTHDEGTTAAMMHLKLLRLRGGRATTPKRDGLVPGLLTLLTNLSEGLRRGFLE